MNTPSAHCLQDLQARSLLAQVTDFEALSARMAAESIGVYAGFDPTAESLHVGSLVPLLTLRRLQRAGHRPIALVGGATGLIGDPSGKTAERQLNGADVVQFCGERLRQQIEPFLDFEASNAAVMVNNIEWFEGMGMLTYLRVVGKLVTVNTLLGRDAVKTRLDREDVGISYTEFSYGLMQAYDFAHLNRRYGCRLQIGGTDQWGNILLGREMTRKLNDEDVFGLTLPLITKADGTKFGKSEGSNIWLSASKTSPYTFFQFWLNSADADVRKFLGFFTFLPVADIDELVASDRNGSGRPQAQRILAEHVTALVHGAEAVRSAQRISAALFSQDVGKLTEGDFEQLALDGLPTTAAPCSQAALPELLVSTGLAESRTQARQLLQQRAVSVNGLPVAANDEVGEPHRLFGRFTLLQRGPKRHALVEWARSSMPQGHGPATS